MILNRPLVKEIVVLSIVVAVLYLLGLKFFLFWTTDWFDILMHFLGGLLIGLIGLFIFYTSSLVPIPKNHTLTIKLLTLGFVLAVGLAWELWEVFVGFTNVLEDQVDTIVDLIMDMVGALFALLYINSKNSNSNENVET